MQKQTKIKALSVIKNLALCTECGGWESNGIIPIITEEREFVCEISCAWCHKIIKKKILN